MFRFNPEKVDWEKELGHGSFGKVYAYKSSQNDDPCVVKHLITNNVDQMLEYVQEIVLGFSCTHPNVLSVRGYHILFDKTTRSWNVFIRLSQMAGSLNDQLIAKKTISEKQIAEYFHDLVNGLGYLHNRGIAHRDIKPDNILINKNNQIQIADFGLCKLLENETYYASKVVGAPRYIAPEILAKKGEENLRLKKRDLLQADLWSLGFIMAELCLSEFGKQSEYELPEKIKKFQGNGYSKVLIELISSLLQFDPSKRKPLHEIQKTLEEHYPFLLEKLNKEGQTNLKIETVPIKKFGEETKVELESEDQRKVFLKEFQEKWKEHFTIEIEPQESVKIMREHLNITDNHLKSLMEEFSYVQNLTKHTEIKEFQINLLQLKILIEQKRRIEKFNKQIAFLLSEEVHRRKTLTVELEFRCEQISDEGIKELSAQIGANLKTIQKLTLSFWGCKQISDKGIKELSAQMGSNLKDLQHLKIFFSHCPEITDDGFSKLSQEIQSNLKKLQSVMLLFEWTKVSQKAKAKLESSCKFIPEVIVR